jgi:lauroyl/myristoyl acyltransferase
MALSKAENGEVQEARINGVEHLHRALEKGKGVILWESSGFGRRLLAKRILYENGFSIHQIHGANDLGGFLTENSSATWARQRLVRRFFYRQEERFVVEIINLPSSNSLEFTRILLNLLNRNAVLCISGDGKTGQKLIPIEFLAGVALFAPGMVSLAKLSGASILPIFCIQESTGAIILTIDSPIRIERDMGRERGLEDSLKEYAGRLEAYVRRYPDLYREWHLLEKLLHD